MPAARLLPPLLGVVAVATVGGLVLAGAVLPGASAAPVSPDASGAGITVAGVGTASATPDVVSTTIGAETTAPTVDAALAAAGTATQAITDALRGEGVAERDIQTAGVQLHPQFGDQGQQVTGYVARQDLTAILRDLGTAGATIAVAVEAGGDAARLSGVSFALADDTALRAEARREAFADARAKAEEYAELAGRELGELISVSEQTGGSGSSFAASAQAASRDSAVPLSAGATQVSVTAQARWALR